MEVLIDNKLDTLLENIQDDHGVTLQFVGGEFRKSNVVGSVIFPYTAQEKFKYYKSDIQDVEDAITIAEKSLPLMKALTLYERAEILLKAASLLEEYLEGFAQIIVYETSKTLKDARGEINRAISTLKFSAEATKSMSGETLPLDAMNGVGKRISFVMHEPIGVVSAITGFNFPLLLAAHKLGPAFGAGNTVVLKPSPGTPISSILFAYVLQKAGLPTGALSVVNGDVEIGEKMVKDPRVKAVSFTGSSAVGKKISEQAEYKKVLLELGSNAATIVDSTDDLEEIATKLVAGGFGSNGQSCISVQRIIVHKELAEELISKLKNKVEQLKIGDPFDATTDVSALFTPSANERISVWLEEAVNKGAVIEVGGNIEDRILVPTLLTNVNPDMNVFKEEIFGPVIAVSVYEEFDEALSMVNSSKYGLQVGVFTKDLGRALKAVTQIDAGSVHVNEISNFRPDHMPYGGTKDSGLGKEGPKYVIEELTNKKVVSFKL